jgi:hypothetical protein
VFQQNAPAPVWGWASPGESVTVAFAGQKKTAVADNEGRWNIKLDPLNTSNVAADLIGFAIAGRDKRFVWADAKIVGETVVVSSPEVYDPSAVRYSWADNPRGNLRNGAGLPASPFATDD